MSTAALADSSRSGQIMTVDGKVVPQVVVAKARREALTSLRAFRVARSNAHGESWRSSSLVSRVSDLP